MDNAKRARKGPHRKPGKKRQGGSGLVTKAQVRQMLHAVDATVMKFFDAGSGGFTTVDRTGGSYGLLSGLSMPAGSFVLPNQRNGYKIQLKTLEVRMNVGVAASGTPDVWNCMRVLIVQVLKPNGATYGPGDFLDASAYGTSSSPYAPLNYFGSKESAGTFKVLYDEVLVVATGGPGATARTVRLPLRGVTVYDGPDGTDDQTLENSIWLSVVSDSGATPHPTFGFVSRITWHDYSS